MSDNIEKTFQIYTQLIQSLLKKPSNEDLLVLYGLYKQSSVGDCNIPKPTGLFDLRGQRKWEAWNQLKGARKQEAMVLYIEKSKRLMEIYK
jgi:diazepam-binding inhibitor (GABA receptor modulating acyl-CoA-binding protein)